MEDKPTIPSKVDDISADGVMAGAVDAVGIEVAVLDRDGVIVSVNGAWEQFGAANGGDATRTGVGASYLEACWKAGGEAGAAEVAAAIGRALTGELASVEIVEITCHSPAKDRWFDVLVSGRTGNDGRIVGASVILTPLRLSRATSGDRPKAASIVRPLSDIPAADGTVAWAMVEASPDALVMADGDGLIELVNRQAELLFGYDRADLLGRPIEILLPERFAQGHRAHRTRFRAAPEVRAMGSGMDLRARRADGSELPVEVSLSPLRVRGELRVIATVREISDRMATESAARRIRHGVDSIRDGVYMFAPDSWEFIYVNEGAVTQSHYSANELMGGMTLLHMAPEFSHDQFVELLAPLIDGSSPSLQFETTMRARTGADLPVEMVMDYPTADRDEQPVIVAVVRDITDRIGAEHEALIIQHSINSASDAVFICDEDTLTFVHVNQAAVDLHGYTKAELLAGMNPADLTPKLPLKRLRRALEDLVDSPETTFRLVIDGETKNGDPLAVDVRIKWPAPSTPTSRRPVLAVVRDVSTEMADAEARRRHEALVAALSEVRLTMLAGASRADGLRLICERVHTTLDAATALIITPTGSGDELGIEAHHGLTDEARAALSFRAGQGVVGEVLSTGQAQLISLGDPRIPHNNRQVIEGGRTGSIVIAALRGGDGVFGVLIVTRDNQAPPLNDQDVAAMEHFAAAAAVAIELAAAQATRSRLDLLEDRERIGRDMHDNVIGRLFATGMSTQSALSRLDDTSVREVLASVVDDIDEAIREIRATVFGLQSDIDRGIGIRNQILTLAADHNKRLGFEPTVNFNGPVDELATNIGEALLATMREAFTNTTKHAKAQSISVDVAINCDNLRMTYRDNGAGFSTLQTDNGHMSPTLTGNGLRNMTTRAEQLGGHATINSSPGAGTTIEWVVPLT